MFIKILQFLPGQNYKTTITVLLLMNERDVSFT
jgi:hypothetical protein